MRRDGGGIALGVFLVTMASGCISIDLLSADQGALDGRGRTERVLDGLDAKLDAYARAPWTSAAKPQREGLSGFLASISAAFREDAPMEDRRSSRLRAYADELSEAEETERRLTDALVADLDRLGVIAGDVDGLRRAMSENWTIAALTEVLNVSERAIGLAVRRRDGFVTVCRRLERLEDAACAVPMIEYGRLIALLRADAEAAAELLQRKSASISS